jgi:MoaA/NifB/PqqE/SkfB family radical SAM enzyme
LAPEAGTAGNVPDLDRLSTLPILLLNVHEHCNCRCLMCDIWQRKDGRELDLDRFARHRESLMRLGVQQVVLTGGEPLLHRRFAELCSFLQGCGARVTLLTTGLLLSKHAAAIADGVDEIIVSLDGPEEVHDQIRRVKGAFQLIHRGVGDVRERKPRMPVHGRSTVQKANHVLLRQTVAAAKFLSLDSISFLAADVASQAFNRALVWPTERQSQIALSREEVAALEDEIEVLVQENANDLRAKYILESPAKLRRIARRFREQLGELASIAPLCNAPWVSAVVEVDGSVRPCFFHRKIGNLEENTLEQAVNNRDAQRFRASLDIETNPICRRCVCSLNYSTGK